MGVAVAGRVRQLRSNVRRAESYWIGPLRVQACGAGHSNENSKQSVGWREGGFEDQVGRGRRFRWGTARARAAQTCDTHAGRTLHPCRRAKPLSLDRYSSASKVDRRASPTCADSPPTLSIAFDLRVNGFWQNFLDSNMSTSLSRMNGESIVASPTVSSHRLIASRSNTDSGEQAFETISKRSMNIGEQALKVTSSVSRNIANGSAVQINGPVAEKVYNLNL